MNAAEIVDAARLPVLYLACPVSAPDKAGVLENLARAERWYRWLVTKMHVSVSAPWLTSCRVLDELNPEHRRIGRRANYAQLSKADAAFFAGGFLSQGMRQEFDFFRGLDQRPRYPRLLDYACHREPEDFEREVPPFVSLETLVSQISKIAQHLRAPS
jgi:hypothetical protein